MANNWTFFGGYPLGKYASLSVDCVEISQDIANNTSTVRLTAVINTNAGVQPVVTGATMTININGGGAIEKAPVEIKRSNSVLVFAREYVIGHSDDGTKTVGYSFKISLDDKRYNEAQVTGGLKLLDIPRPDNILAHDCFFGDTIQLAVSQNAQDFTHDIRYSYDYNEGYIAKGVTGNQNWTVPIDFLEHITDRPSAQIIFYCDTFLNGNLTGTRTSTITANVPASAKPVLHEFELTENNVKALACGLDKDYFVQSFSQVTANAKTAEGYRGSTIRSFTCQIKDSIALTDKPVILDTAGTFEVQAYVTDSRGMQSDIVSKTIHVLEYHQPVLNISARRSGETNTTATITRNISIAPLAINNKQHNTAKLSFRYAVSGSNVYLEDTGAGGSWTDIAELVNSDANMSASFDEAKNYIIEATLSDNFLTQVVTTNLLIANNYVYSYDKNKRFAVGKITDNSLPDGSIESTGGFYLNGKNILSDIKSASQENITNIVNDAVSEAIRDIKSQNEPQRFEFNTGTGIRVRNTVYLQFEYYHNAPNRAANLGVLPEGCRPEKTTTVTGSLWTTGKGESIPIFIQTDGNMYIYAIQQRTLRCQVSFNVLL
ncbi:hypothetical protein RO10_09365 [Streptococcus mutans]|uniref:DUF859 family phage minor structural protein n=1 Tax=Streptococcus mutans TaxID=1309 RepID=UPI000A37EE4F|nr:DUF859 family phage minor structural protein [Streptococcus mutans]ARS63293.1 hypothetical protein RO10_09150 [Streptococcus mutans]ARS63332.1 hypothetical protein RO10_09365 [Streptococcus mutans]